MDEQIRQRHKEDGVVLVEAAIVISLLALLFMGILEYGLLFGKTIDVASAARAGARAGVASGETAPSDHAILAAMSEALGEDADGIQRVTIYRASGTDSQPTDACLVDMSVADHCNVYTRADFSLSESALDASPHAQGWPSASRVPLDDYVGVVVQAKHTFVSGMFQRNMSFRDSVVMRLEPVAPSSASASRRSDDWTTGVDDLPLYSEQWLDQYPDDDVHDRKPPTSTARF